MKELSKLIDKSIIEKPEVKERNLEIEINFYNSIKSSIYYNIEVFSDRRVPPLAITFKKDWKAFKNGIEIFLDRHLIYTRLDIEEDRLDSLVKELTDSLVHELIHYIGELRENYEREIDNTVKAMLFRDKYLILPKWVIDEDINRI